MPSTEYRAPVDDPIHAFLYTDITYRVIERGEFHKQKIQKTLSDAINIEVVRRPCPVSVSPKRVYANNDIDGTALQL